MFRLGWHVFGERCSCLLHSVSCRSVSETAAESDVQNGAAVEMEHVWKCLGLKTSFKNSAPAEMKGVPFGCFSIQVRLQKVCSSGNKMQQFFGVQAPFKTAATVATERVLL